MSDAASWLSAAGTIGAVGVALFPQSRRWIWRPRVVVGHDQAAFNVRREPSGGYVAHCYVRLCVRAKRRQPGADGLQATLLRCRPAARLGGRDELEQEELRVALRWAYTHDDAIALNPGAVRYVDLCEIRADEPGWARLALQRGPDEGYYLIKQDRSYVLEVELAAANLDAELWYVVLGHRGRWNGKGDLQVSIPVQVKKHPPKQVAHAVGGEGIAASRLRER